MNWDMMKRCISKRVLEKRLLLPSLGLTMDDFEDLLAVVRYQASR